MHDKLQEHLAKEQQLQTELDKNELLLKLLLNYKLSHKDGGEKKTERKIYLKQKKSFKFFHVLTFI